MNIYKINTPKYLTYKDDLQDKSQIQLRQIAKAMKIIHQGPKQELINRIRTKAKNKHKHIHKAQPETQT